SVDERPDHGTEAVPDTDITVAWHRRGDQAELELASMDLDDAGPRRVDATVEIVHELLATAAMRGATPTLAAAHPPESWRALPEALADALAFTPSRLLLQLRRELPVPADHPARRGPSVDVRPISPSDADAWIRVNNRAFVDHPAQGRETRETLAARQAESWYDPAGFLVADDRDRPGELSGFC